MLNLVGINTLNKLTFADVGGNGTPSVNANGMAITLTTTSGSPTITVPFTNGLAVGQSVTGTGIPAGTTILSIAGNTITLSANATTSASNSLSFGGTLTLTDANAITAVTDNYATIPTVSASQGLVFSNAAPVINVSGASIGNLLISAPITGAGGVITKTGTGVLILSSNAGTFSSGFEVQSGSLTLANNSTGTLVNQFMSGPLGTGTLVLDTGTTIQSDGTGRTLLNPVTINGNVTFGGGTAGNNVTLAGPVNLGSTTPTLTVTNPLVTAALAGPLNGTAGLTKNGNGILVLSGQSTAYSGPTFVSSGVLKLGVAQNLSQSELIIGSGAGGTVGAAFDLAGNAATFGSLASDTPTTGGFITNSSGTAATLTVGVDNTSTTFGGTLSAGSGALNVTKVGTGTLTLTGTNTLTGALTAAGGSLVFDYTTNNTTKLGTGPLGLSGGNLTLLGNATAATTQTAASTLVGPGLSSVTLTPGSGQTLTLNTGVISHAGGIVNFAELPTGATVNVGATPLFNGLLGAWATISVGSNTFFASKDINNNLIASSSTYGNTAKDDITTWKIADDVKDSTGYINTIVGGNAVNSIEFNANVASSNVAMASNVTLDVASGGILMTSNVGANNRTISGGGLTAASGELLVTQNGTGTLTIGSNLTGVSAAQNLTGSAASSNLAFTKFGTGMVILSGNNTYTGNTTINQGTVQLAGGHAIGDYSTVVLANTAGVTLDLNNTTETVGPLQGGGAVGGTISIGTGSLTSNHLSPFFNVGVNTIYSGAITGSGSFIVNGSGSQQLDTISNTFTGAIAVTGGANLILSGSGVNNFSQASSLTVSGASLTLDYNASTTSGDRLSDTAPVTLSNTAFQANSQYAGFNGAINGLTLQTNVAAVRNETIGAITLGGGANQITGNTFIGTTAVTDALVNLTAASLTRTNASTLVIRGSNLGTVAFGTNQGATVVLNTAPTLVGGTGAAGTTTIPILPWAVADTSANFTAANMGFVTYGTSGASNGFRVLSTANEYENLAAGGGVTLLNNVRYSSGSNLTMTGSSHTMNALWLDNTSTTAAITVAGSATDSLNVQSGAFLFTGTQGITLSTFTNGITTGTNNEYILNQFDTNTVTISASLTTANSTVTKTGNGLLVLSGTGNTVTTYNLNQGVLQASAATNLVSSGTTTLNFYGGTFRFGAVFDLSADTLNFNTGGGALDTNNLSVTFANSIGNGSAGAFTKTGSGTLTVGGAINVTGPVNVTNGTLALNNAANSNAAIGAGGLFIGGPNSTTSAIVSLSADEQINDTAAVTIQAVTGSINTQLNLNNHKETIGALTISGGTATASLVSGVTTGTGTLVLNGDLNFINTRAATGNSGREVLITSAGTTSTANFNGTGKLDLGGVQRNITVTSPNTGANIAGSDATIETIIQNGGINKFGGRTLYLTNANTYGLATNIYEGVLAIGTATGLGVGDGAAATGTTVFDGGTLQLGFTQAGTTDGTFTVANEKLVINGQGGALSAGALRNSAGNNTWQTLVTMGSDARVSSDAGILTLNNGIVSAGGAAFNLSVGGQGSAAGTAVVINVTSNNGGGSLLKDGASTLILNTGSNNFSSVTVNGSGVLGVPSVLATTARSGGYGTGPITVNPGGIIRFADATDISNAAGVTLTSDNTSLAGLGMGYNGPVPTILTSGTALPGQVVAHANAAGFGGELTLDVPNFTQSLDLSAIGNGMMLLGTTYNSGLGGANSATMNYLAPSLKANSDGIYHLGAGSNSGNLAFGAGVFENVFTTPGANIQIGTLTPSGTPYSDGIGNITLNGRNTNLTSAQTVTVNAGSRLNIANSYALGGATLDLNNVGNNGALVQFNASIKNNIVLLGDTFANDGGTDNSIFGNVILDGGNASTTRTFINNGTANTVLGFEGVISGNGINIVKATNGQTIVFNGNNTYTGTTTISNGFLMAGTDVLANTNGAFGNSNTAIVLSGGSLGLSGQITIGRNITVNNTTVIRAQTVGNSVITGAMTVAASQTLRFDQATTPTSFVGGVLDVQGVISGAGGLGLGNDPQASATTTGTVRIIGNNTFTGGTTLRQGRTQINSNTAFGTGSLTFGPGGFGNLGVVEAYGSARTITNTLGSINWNGNTVLEFGGHNSLTFTSAMNVNNESGTSANRTRQFTVSMTQGVTTFSGNFTNTQPLALQKAGAGTLVLSGVNTQADTATTDTLYGTGIAVNGGTLQVAADTALGQTTSLIVGGGHTIAGAADVRLGGGVLATTASFATSRLFIYTANSGIDVASGTTLTENQITTGAFTLTKTGNGTLALNPATPGSLTESITGLTIGGAPLTSAANQLSGTGGGTVSTTATGGSLVAATGSITINGGTLSLIGNSTTAQALTIPTVTFGSGSYIQLNKSGTGSALTATALTRVNQGTLTILPSALGNLGTGAPATSEDLITSTTYTNPNGMLALPDVYIRLAGTGQDANFAQYGGANGFAVNNAVTTTALDGSAPATDLADLSSATTVGNAVGQTVDILAVRTSANISSFDPSDILRINNGGLIMNGSTAPTISSNLFFGTSAGAAEALVYVRDGQTGTSTISGNITATNFTKSGPGTLLLSGTKNVMTIGTTGLGTMQINEGTIQFAGQSSLPNQGQFIISPMDKGAFDLNGQNLTIAGLGGNAAASAATGNVINSGAGNNVLTVAPQQGTTSIFNGLISGNISLVTQGIGTLTLGYNNTFTGTTTIGAGNIPSASGLYTANGTLQINDYNSLGSNSNVVLAGGTLAINDPVAGPEVINDTLVTILGSGNGYNFTVAGTNSLGSDNTTSTVTVASAAANTWQAINNLTFQSNADNNYVFNVGATNTGFLVGGTTTLAGNTTFNVAGNLNLAGQILASGNTVTKLGAGTLFVSNTNLSSSNNVGAWNVYAGTLEARTFQGDSANPLGNGVAVTLNGGTLNLRNDGDGLNDPQILNGYVTNNIVVGSTTPASSASYIGSANSTLDVRTFSGIGANKTIQIGQVQFGGALGGAQLTVTGGNGFGLEITNGIRLLGRDAIFANGTSSANSGVPVTVDGTISGNGTFVHPAPVQRRPLGQYRGHG
ncbi:autotransporter-associated beta strand repeat protein [Chthoniobacter flavus Ellin428]|uniref:Autotransporter-associated beta strand repeat protein n=1 Tax=Chthoniobacter flavus Ellin428 TaxID=497964 RepID=B4CYP1_9BACT|nr:autotransporter-associated beta strand repeat-containing protein [Chthoniobacter flavus]EDY20582.1 autotransporter-associated beta strand repeat protein [Chthoniobacter flavus Ellin428]